VSLTKIRTRFVSSGRGAASEAPDERVVGAVHDLARGRGVPMTQIALAWLLQRPTVVAPIVGATQFRHLDDAIAGLTIRLDADELAGLERDYVHHAVVGYS
jgi:aryl-alcohol dehydrogenase-like predicted oxidoreductase